MPKQNEAGIPAMFKYQSLKYFPFGTEPGASYVLTSDPWSYLKAWLNFRIDKSRTNKLRYKKAKYFVEQAESFQLAADNTRLPTKATLTYYSLLNLSKAFLSTRGLDLEKREESHGLSLTDVAGEIKVLGNLQNCTNIFLEFSKALGKPLTGQHLLKIEDVISDIPEVHELAYTLNLISKKKFLPVDIEFKTNESHNKLFTEIKYKKENEARLPTDKFYKGLRAAYLKQISSDSIWVVYRSVSRKSYSNKNMGTIYKNSCKEYSKLDISLLLTRDGYKPYVNLIPNAYHQLANVLIVHFFMGTAARYRPTVTQNLMGGALHPIISEVINTTPRQFLYQITSMMTCSICAVPKAVI